VSFVEFLRGERKFSGVEELRSQLQNDIAQARAALT
jgi:FAD synthase